MKMRWLFLILIIGVCAISKSMNAQASSIDHPLRVGSVAPGMRIGGQQAVYPLAARAAGIEGSVSLKITITIEGKTENVRVIGGPPELQMAALDAAKTWIFRPYLSSRHPVEKDITQSVNFRLGDTPAEKSEAQTKAKAKLAQDAAAPK